MISFAPVHSATREEVDRVFADFGRRIGVKVTLPSSVDLDSAINFHARRMGKALNKRVGQLPPSGSLGVEGVNRSLDILARRLR